MARIKRTDNTAYWLDGRKPEVKEPALAAPSDRFLRSIRRTMDSFAAMERSTRSARNALIGMDFSHVESRTLAAFIGGTDAIGSHSRVIAASTPTILDVHAAITLAWARMSEVWTTERMNGTSLISVDSLAMLAAGTSDTPENHQESGPQQSRAVRRGQPVPKSKTYNYINERQRHGKAAASPSTTLINLTKRL